MSRSPCCYIAVIALLKNSKTDKFLCYIKFVSEKVQDRIYTGFKSEHHRWPMVYELCLIWVSNAMFDISLLGPKNSSH